MRKKSNIIKKISVMLFTAILALTSLSSVFAATGSWPTSGTGDITVHKYFRDSASTTPGDGQEITDPDEIKALGTPANNTDKQVGFTLYKVNESDTFEVTTSTTVDQALANATPVGSEEVTDVNGEITWTDLAYGYYVLVETTSATGYTPAASTIIALPYALNGNDWNDKIHVYPKNVNEKPLIKTVVDENAAYNIGDTITWKYSAQVEDYTKLYTADNGAGTPAYGTYKIVDVLDERLDYDSTTSIKGTGGTDVTLTEDTGSGGDYTIATDATDNSVTWTLTNSGLEKLAANKITSLEVVFDTKVNAKAAAEGEDSDEILNGGELTWKNIGDSEDSSYEIEEGDKPVAKLFSLEIIKTNNKDTTDSEVLYLNGAKFKIATSKANADSGTFLQDADGNDIEVTTADYTDTSTDPATIIKGWAKFSGLTGSLTADTEYYLVETVAPTYNGIEYVRPTEPIKVTLKANTQTTTEVIKNYLITDPDLPEIWELPLTGGVGTIAFYAVGIVLMIGAVTLYIRSKRVNRNR